MLVFARLQLSVIIVFCGVTSVAIGSIQITAANRVISATVELDPEGPSPLVSDTASSSTVLLGLFSITEQAHVTGPSGRDGEASSSQNTQILATALGYDISGTGSAHADFDSLSPPGDYAFADSISRVRVFFDVDSPTTYDFHGEFSILGLPQNVSGRAGVSLYNLTANSGVFSFESESVVDQVGLLPPGSYEFDLRGETEVTFGGGLSSFDFDFSLQSIPAANAVPEAGSVAVWSLLGLLGCCWARRREHGRLGAAVGSRTC